MERRRREKRRGQMQQPQITPELLKEASKPDLEVNPLSPFFESEHIGPAIKNLFETSKTEEVQVLLGSFIQTQNAQIEEICNFHYQEFIKAIDDLLKVRETTKEFKEEVKACNDQVQVSGQELLQKSQRLLKTRESRQNIEEAINTVQDCLFVLGLCKKLNEFIDQRKYYHALKILDQLQKNYLRRVSEYSFAKLFEKRIPLFKETIKKNVTSEFNNWLLMMRERSPQIGKIALEQTKAEIQKGEEMMKKGKDKAARKTESQLISIGVFDQVKVDFAPLYQCLHIYDNLGVVADFQDYYKENRRMQANLAVRHDDLSNVSFFETYTSYFHQIAGFFVVEEAVFRTTGTFLTRSFMDDLWSMALAKVKAVLAEQFSYCSTPSTVVEVKSFMYLFAHTLKGFSYDVQVLLDFIETLREIYSKVSIEMCSKLFSKLLREEQHELIFSTQESMKQVLEFELEDPDILRSSLPWTPPFSSMVPACLEVVTNFIMDVSDFAKGFPDKDVLVAKATDHLMKTLNSEIVTLLTTVPLSVDQIIQIAGNLKYFTKSCRHLERLVDPTGQGNAKLSSASSFVSTRELTERVLFESAKRKINEIILSAHFNGMTANVSAKAGDYINAIFGFLGDIYNKMTAQNHSSPDELYLKACQYFNDILVNQFAGEEIKQFNFNFILNMSKDVEQITSTLTKSPVAKSPSCFTEIKQLVGLMLSENLEIFFDENQFKSKFNSLTDTAKLIVIFERYREEGGGFFGFFGSSPAKIKTLDVFIRRLKEKKK